jgi:hypothetical protein
MLKTNGFDRSTERDQLAASCVDMELRLLGECSVRGNEKLAVFGRMAGGRTLWGKLGDQGYVALSEADRQV